MNGSLGMNKPFYLESLFKNKFFPDNPLHPLHSSIVWNAVVEKFVFDIDSNQTNSNQGKKYEERKERNGIIHSCRQRGMDRAFSFVVESII